MKAILALPFLFTFCLLADDAAPDTARLKQLDAFWAEVSRAVGAGDFAAYEDTCHPEGVLVSGSKKTSTPLADALKRWKKEFDATKEGKMKASVEFKFSQRLGDATTAHETGMFLYSAVSADGQETHDYIHFEALLVKHGDRWKSVMEYQKSKGTRAEFDAIPRPLPAPGRDDRQPGQPHPPQGGSGGGTQGFRPMIPPIITALDADGGGKLIWEEIFATSFGRGCGPHFCAPRRSRTSTAEIA